MTDYILIALAALLLVGEILLFVTRPKKTDDTAALRETERRLQDELSRRQSETDAALRSLQTQLGDMKSALLQQQTQQQEQLYRTLAHQTEKMTLTLTEAVERLQTGNEKKLEEMRVTVDEKLTSTLNSRLSESFRTVGEQLQAVHKSLGEMQTLAGDVGDLQRVLSNVKVRGTWAEVQLGNILEQTLTQDQYVQNVAIKRGSQERVEYAVRIPSRLEEGKDVLLPIDSKFPQEDYVRLSEAAEKNDAAGVEAAGKALEQRIKREAMTIRDLYISVPTTTDFAIMFLPTEGLYAEVLRRAGLVEELQTKYRVMVCGPTTVTAFLNTLRMGFRTVALDKRAAEVWKILGAAKQQYEKFGDLIAKARKKIDEAGTALDDAEKRNAIIQKNLRSVETLPDAGEADRLLGIGDSAEG